MTEHEANNAIMWISDKLWQSLTAEQKQWVDDGGEGRQPGRSPGARSTGALGGAKLEKMGVKIVSDVDKAGFQESPTPISTSSARDLGPTPTDQDS